MTERATPWTDWWRPITTAPKNGTRVLLIDENDPSPDAVCTGWWMMDEWRDYGDLGCNGQTEYEPTHWMPLPFGPNATISGGEGGNTTEGQ